MNNTMIEAGWLAKAIADHLRPIESGCYVKNIGKATREHHPEHPNNWRHENLSALDVDLLDKIWHAAGLLSEKLTGEVLSRIEQSDWSDYKTSFDESPLRPNWELTCGFNDRYLTARSENSAATIQHQKAIEAASTQGDLRLFTENHVPTNKVEYGTLIRRDDAESYLGSIGLPINLLEQQAPDPQSVETTKTLPSVPQKYPFDDLSKMKSERQVLAILHWIQVKGFDPCKIPDGGKGDLQQLCGQSDETKGLFTADSAFESAWRKAKNQNLVRMENHSSFAKRGE